MSSLCPLSLSFFLTDLNISGVCLSEEVVDAAELTFDWSGDAFILSSSRHEAIKLKPRKSSWAFALGGTPGESKNQTPQVIFLFNLA